MNIINTVTVTLSMGTKLIPSMNNTHAGYIIIASTQRIIMVHYSDKILGVMFSKQRIAKKEGWRVPHTLVLPSGCYTVREEML